MKIRMFIILTTILIVGGFGVYLYVGRAQDARETTSIPRSMAVSVARDSLSRTISAAGRLEPAQDRTLQFRVGGTIDEIMVQEGDFVEAGADIARLDQRNAYLDLLRKERAYEQSLLESVESMTREARLELEMSRSSYEGTVLKAPFSGIVASIDAIVGSSVNAQSAIVRLVSRDEFKIAVDLDEIELRSVHVGQEVLVSVDSLPGLRLVGRVTKIGWVPSSTGSSVVYPVEISVNAPSAPTGMAPSGMAPTGTAPAGMTPSGTAPAAAAGRFPQQGVGMQGFRVSTQRIEPQSLRPGLSVTIDIVVESAHDVLVVPLAAVVESGGRSVVSKVLADGAVEVVPVETGISDGLRVAVLSGLSEGDEILMNNYQLYQTLPQSGGQQRGGAQLRFNSGGLPIAVPAGGVRIP